jgi:hypothetical protein
MPTLPELIERRLDEAGLPAAVEEVEGAIVVSGMVTTEDERTAILDIVAEEAHDAVIEDNIEVVGTLAETFGGMKAVELAADIDEVSQPGTRDETLAPGDFEDQRLLKYPEAAAGPTDNIEDDHAGEGDVVYVPPTDPVKTPDNQVLGGFAITSMDQAGVARSSDGTLGDEAIAAAVRRELAEDAATAALVLDVEVAQGLVVLRGAVPDIEDVENAEEVAARVPGVLEVREELQVENV